jgi:hypothetical protein
MTNVAVLTQFKISAVTTVLISGMQVGGGETGKYWRGF